MGVLRDLDQRRVRISPEEVNDLDSCRRRCHGLSIDLFGQEVRCKDPRGSGRHAG
jgi:hypothetical protein